MITPDELLSAWLNNLKEANHPPKTVLRYGGVVRRFLILGHESLGTTKIYTHPTPGELAQSVEQITLNAYG